MSVDVHVATTGPSMQEKSRKPRAELVWLIVVVLAIASLGVGIHYGGEESPQASKRLTIDRATDSHDSGVLVAPPAESRRSVARAADQEKVKFRDPALDEEPRQLYAVSNLAAQFEGLASMAENGDLIAARTLLERLGICSNAQRTPIALQKKKDKIKNAYYIYKDLPGGIETALRYEDTLYQYCGALTDEQRESHPRWAEQLADAGDTEARLQFSAIPQPNAWDRVDAAERRQRFVEKAKGYLNAEIAAGNGRALAVMAQSYMRPIISGAIVPFEIDPAMAYRYYYAYAQTSESRNGTAYIKTPSSEGVVDLASNTLIRLESQLTPEQIANERREANAILKACCS